MIFSSKLQLGIFHCCNVNEETITLLFTKNISLFFIATKGSKWLHMRERERERKRKREKERERERERERETNCYHWHHAGTHFQSLTSFWLFDGRFDTEPVFSRGAAWPSLRLTYLLAGYSPNDWPNLTDLMIPLSLCNILMPIYFSFWFSIHVINFRHPFFTQVQYPVLESLTNRSVKCQYITITIIIICMMR